jgi:hypothetical protein
MSHKGDFFIGLVLMALSGATPLFAQAGTNSWRTFMNSNSFRPVDYPGAIFELGGLIIPGQEQYGTVLVEKTRQVFGLTPDTPGESLIPNAPLAVDRRLTLAIVAGQTLPNSCRKPRFYINEFAVLRAKIPRSETQPSEQLERLAELALVPPAQLHPDVVVTAIVNGHYSVQACSDDATRLGLVRRAEAISLGYRAGAIADANEGVGKQGVLKILQLFELADLTKSPDRSLKIQGIETQPSGARIGWIELLQLGRTPAAQLPDERFRWLGDTPIGPYAFWAGTFFFRVKAANGKTDTQQIDLTLSDAGRTLKLHVVN